MNPTGPVTLTERAPILDALRGFALLGVLIDNLFAFSGWVFLNDAQREGLATWPADGLVGILEMTFIHGKFYSMFSLLFGIGFSVILIRNQQRGINPIPVFYKRLAILMLIGAAHLFLLWEGDILLLYSIVGLFLPLFIRARDRTILIWAFALILAPVLIDTIRVLFQFNPGDHFLRKAVAIDMKNNLPQDASQYIFDSKDAWIHWRNWMEPGFYYRYSDLLNDNRFFKVLGMFLFGFYAGRKMMYVRLEDYRNIFKKLRKWGLIIGIPAAIATSYFFLDDKRVPNRWGLFDTFFYAISVVPLCLAYVSWVCLRWIKTGGKTIFNKLIPLGRMALTNYLLQTVFGIIIYYGIGFGLGGNIGPSVYVPIGLAVYLLQIVYSTWWLKHFNYGPFEWLWRMLTYGKWLPLKKS